MSRPSAALAFAAWACFSLARCGAGCPAPDRPQPFHQGGPCPADAAAGNGRHTAQRSYPDQPPLIPHAIEGYALDLNANKCLACHARKFTEQSQAPMISVTHYQDRDGNTLGGVSPRRYSCLSCHVPQTGAPAARAEHVHRHGRAGRTRTAGAADMAAIARAWSWFWANPGCARRRARPSPVARLPHARRVRRGRDVLGRLQHGAGGDQHREVLHIVPRDAGQCVRGAQDDHSLHEPLRVYGPPVPIVTCRTSGPTRSPARCRPPRKSGVTFSARSIPARNSWRCAAPRRARMGAHESEQLAGMPQLPQRSVDGLPSRIRAPRPHTERLLFTRREDLHRLPQGHRAQTAEHAGRPGMAVGSWASLRRGRARVRVGCSRPSYAPLRVTTPSGHTSTRFTRFDYGYTL